MIEITHSLLVISPHCSAKWADLPPTGISLVTWKAVENAVLENLEEEETDLEEGNCLELLVLCLELLVLLAGKSFLVLEFAY